MAPGGAAGEEEEEAAVAAAVGLSPLTRPLRGASVGVRACASVTERQGDVSLRRKREGGVFADHSWGSRIIRKVDSHFGVQQ